ncbi:hypothetical protein [Methylobacterium ajmalii]|uniref:hypothetical protein n=1 Tax=Methylobacterium ajmalii TaxID=2738439 RepID=UPI002F356DFB
MPSKSDAGLYGLITFQPEWHRIIDEALRVRREPEATGLYGTLEERGRDALAFVRIVADDARTLVVNLAVPDRAEGAGPQITRSGTAALRFAVAYAVQSLAVTPGMRAGRGKGANVIGLRSAGRPSGVPGRGRP